MRRSAYCFLFKALVNLVFTSSFALKKGGRTPVNIALMSLLLIANIPVYICSLQTYKYKIKRSIYATSVYVTMVAEFSLLLAFYFSLRSWMFFFLHVAISLVLDFFVFFSGRKAPSRERSPDFEIGRCKVAVMVGPKLILQKMETVRVLRLKGDLMLIRKLNGEEHHVSASLIEEETASLI